jgi:hypothetical protein
MAMHFRQVARVEYFPHLAEEIVGDGADFFFAHALGGGAKQVLVEVEVVQHHLGVEDVFLINVHIHHLVQITDIVAHEILD